MSAPDAANEFRAASRAGDFAMAMSAAFCLVAASNAGEDIAFNAASRAGLVARLRSAAVCVAAASNAGEDIAFNAASRAGLVARLFSAAVGVAGASRVESTVVGWGSAGKRRSGGVSLITIRVAFGSDVVIARTGRVMVFRKGQDWQWLPLDPDVVEGLRECFRQIHPDLDDYVFTVEVEQWASQFERVRRRKDPKQPASSQALGRTVKRVCERAGIRALSPHPLRHGFANRFLRESDRDLASLQAMLGHSRPDTTQA